MDSIDSELDELLHTLSREDADSGVFPIEDRSRVIAGRYEIVEELGAGGMGRVLHVRHQRLGKPFALKLMQADFSQHPEAEQIFRREAQLASQLSHPNIVETVDFGHDPDWGWFIAMQYLEGEPLSVVVERQGQLPVTVVLDIAVQLADALKHSHQKGVVHADVKSENVLCLAAADDERRHWQIKLLDFGTAQFSAEHAAPSGPATRVTGTPEYLAPERILGGPSQPSNDLYSLGIIIYEMLTGKPPFLGDPGTVLVRHISEQPEPAGARRGEVLDARLDAILDKALAKDPQQRYARAEDILADLRGYMDALGLQRRAGVAAHDIVVRAGERIEAAVAAFDALRLPIAGLQRDGTIVVANASFARLLGTDAASVIGRDARETFLSHINPDLRDDLRIVALNGKAVRRDLPVERDGKRSTLRYTLSPASGACGHCVLVLYQL
jgi:eukaryotic-like serine/threonine-protein kinase